MLIFTEDERKGKKVKTARGGVSLTVRFEGRLREL